ncbi:MAG: DUF3810 family protein [Saprospiraceae bacterium]|nr:DUF3810 family protein [Saprospiraceae bacterium]
MVFIWIIASINTLLILIALLIFFCICYEKDFVEKYYYHYLFKSYRVVWAKISESVSFSLSYCWLIGVISILYFVIRIRSRSSNPMLFVIWHFVLILLAHLAYFYIFWGFNYYREPIKQKLQLEGAVKLSELENTLVATIYDLNSTRMNITFQKKIELNELNNTLCQELNNFLDSNNLSSFCPVKCKRLWPKGSLLVLSTAGIYWPFAGESMIDAGLHPIEVPFTMTHELAHGMGWTDEGECNWLAFESCLQSKNLMIRYSALISFYKYLIYSYPQKNQFNLDSLKSTLSKDVRSDLIEIKQMHDKYPDFYPDIRNAIYDWYLKKNNVQSGLISYNEFVGLVINYNKKYIQQERNKIIDQ